MFLHSLTARFRAFKSPLLKFGPIGFDLGEECLHMIQMKPVGDRLRIHANLSKPYEVPRQEIVASPREFKRFVRRALQEGRFHGRNIVTCMPSGKTKIINLHYQVRPDLDETESIVEGTLKTIDRAAQDCVIDYLPIRQDDKDATNRSALVAVCMRHEVVPYLELLDQGGLEVLALDIGPAALRRMVAFNDKERTYPTVLLINFGREKSYLTMIAGRRLMMDQAIDFGEENIVSRLCWTLMMDREIDFGENTIVSRLSTSLDMAESQALELISTYGFQDVLPGEEGQDDTVRDIVKTISEILEPLFLKFVEEVNKVLIYTASETRGGAIEKIYILGSVARYPAAEKFLGQMLSLPLQILNPLACFEEGGKSTTAANSPTAGVAMATGLALRGFDAYG